MTQMENAEKFLSHEQWQKLAEQLYPVCEKHCPQDMQCIRGIAVECPIQAYIEHLRRHTRLCSAHIKAKTSAPVIEASYTNELKKELACPEHSRIKVKLQKISLITKRLTDTGYSVKLEHSLGEIRNLMEELHEFDTMIRDVDSMVLRGYFYTCLDRLTEKCRSFEEDMRWARAERDNELSFQTDENGT